MYSGSKTGSATGIAYTSDGLHLLFGQDSGYLAIVNVDPATGLITSNVARVNIPLDAATTAIPDLVLAVQLGLYHGYLNGTSLGLNLASTAVLFGLIFRAHRHRRRICCSINVARARIAV